MKLSPTGLLEPTARRLSALDASFLRLESSRAHMHVGWSALFDVPDPNRRPWEICLISRLEDGRMAMVGKIHHALVDGIGALQIVGLIVDEPEQGDGVAASSGNHDRAAPSTSGPQDPLARALGEVAHAARAGLGRVRL